MPFSKWVCSLVPTDPADLDIKGRSQVADITIIRTGKVVKANHKTLRQKGTQIQRRRRPEQQQHVFEEYDDNREYPCIYQE